MAVFKITLPPIPENSDRSSLDTRLGVGSKKLYRGVTRREHTSHETRETREGERGRARDDGSLGHSTESCGLYYIAFLGLLCIPE